MNLGDMRTLVRRDLHDEDSGSYRWTNDEIERHIARAIREFSEALPLEQKATIATTPGSREISLSTLSNRVTVAAVEYPVGKFPPSYQRFALWSETVTLLGSEIPDGSNACVYYGKLHTLDATTSTLPAAYEDLIAAGAAGFAALEWAVYAANRVNTGGAATAPVLEDWARERLARFRSELKRLGRKSRVRARSLFYPYSPPVSKTTDAGP